MVPDCEAVAVSPPADDEPIGAAESATSDVTRPLPVVLWNWRTVADAGAVQPVVEEDLFDQSETIHDVGEALTAGVVCDALLRVSANDVADATGSVELVPEYATTCAVNFAAAVDATRTDVPASPGWATRSQSWLCI